jgi:hypothetical protein
MLVALVIIPGGTDRRITIPGWAQAKARPCLKNKESKKKKKKKALAYRSNEELPSSNFDTGKK